MLFALLALLVVMAARLALPTAAEYLKSGIVLRLHALLSTDTMLLAFLSLIPGNRDTVVLRGAR